MNIYLIYSADFYDRSTGTVLLNDKKITEKEYEEIVKIAKQQTDGYESSIVEYLVKYYNFTFADVTYCNVEDV